MLFFIYAELLVNYYLLPKTYIVEAIRLLLKVNIKNETTLKKAYLNKVLVVDRLLSMLKIPKIGKRI